MLIYTLISRWLFVALMLVLSLMAYESRFEHAYPFLNDMRTVSGLWFSNFQHFTFGLITTLTSLLFLGDTIFPKSKKDLALHQKKMIVYGMAVLPVLIYIAWWEFYYQPNSIMTIDYVDVCFDLTGVALGFIVFQRYLLPKLLPLTDRTGGALFFASSIPLMLILSGLYDLYKFKAPLSMFFS